MALSGTLDSFALPDVLRLLASTTKTGRLRVTGDRGAGSVWVQDGEIVATDLTSSGPVDPTHADVVFGLLRFSSGSFTFEAEARAADSSMPEQLEPILVTAEHMLMDWRAIEEVVPSLDVYVTLAPEPSGGDVMIDAGRWRCIAAVGGGATADVVGATLGQNEIEVCRSIKELVELGLLEIGEAPPESERESERDATLASSDPEPAEPVAFDTAPEAEAEAVEFAAESENETEAEFAAESEAEFAAVAEFAAEGEAEFAAESEADSDTEAEAEAETEAEAGTGTETETEYESDSDSEADSDSDSDTDSGTESGHESELASASFGVDPDDAAPASFASGTEIDSASDGLESDGDRIATTSPGLAGLGADDTSADLSSPAGVMAADDNGSASPFGGASAEEIDASDLDPAEMARQLANLSPKAAKAVAAAAKASTDAERDAALAAVEAEDETVNRGLLLKFLGSVDT